MSIALKAIALILVAFLGMRCRSEQKTITQKKETAPKEDTAQKKTFVMLEGVENFRDLGGYMTKEGKIVREGVLYRSAALTKLTDDDKLTLRKLKLTKIIDLRSDIEIDKKPDRVPEFSHWFHRQIGTESVNPDKFRNKVLAGHYDGQSFRQMGIDGYRQMVAEAKDFFPSILNDILQNNYGSTVFHCAGGKDRTGIVAALLYSILEVPREQIIEEYLLTNIQREESFKKKFKYLQQASGNILDEGLAQAMMANAEYINSAFKTIDENYGGMDSYISNYLKIDPRKIDQLKSKMLRK